MTEEMVFRLALCTTVLGLIVGIAVGWWMRGWDMDWEREGRGEQAAGPPLDRDVLDTFERVDREGRAVLCNVNGCGEAAPFTMALTLGGAEKVDIVYCSICNGHRMALSLGKVVAIGDGEYLSFEGLQQYDVGGDDGGS